MQRNAPRAKSTIRPTTSNVSPKTATRYRSEQNVLAIEGRKTETAARDYLYQGISARHFRRTFNLADYVKVEGASFDNGLLRIKLVREIPEAMKPRRIPITPGASLQIENKPAKQAA
jgi:molecular chaperone IbpA